MSPRSHASGWQYYGQERPPFRGRARPGPGIGLGLSAPAPYRHRRTRSDRSCLQHRGGAHPLGAARPRDGEPANVLHSARRHRCRVSAACARRLGTASGRARPTTGVSWRHRSCSMRSAGPTRTRRQGSKRFAVISPSTRRESIVLSTASVWRHNRAAFMADGSPLKLSARSRATRARVDGEAECHTNFSCSAPPRRRPAEDTHDRSAGCQRREKWRYPAAEDQAEVHVTVAAPIGTLVPSRRLAV